MKKILLLLFCTIATYTHAQEIDCKEFVQTEFINKIRNYSPTDLVPYSTDGKNWSLIDAKSKKVVTNSVLQYPTTFKKNLHLYLSNCEVRIKQNLDFTYGIPEVSGAEPKGLFINARATKESLGFLVDNNGNMTAYSKTYKRKENFYDSQNISEAIKYNNEYYAVLHKVDQDVLIDQEGNEQKGFVFKEAIVLPYPHKDEPLLYVKDFEDKRGFITLSGKKILYGKLMSYPLTNNNYFGYSIQRDEDVNIADIKKSGVLDLVTQKWLIKPQKKYKIYSMIYTSEEKINEEDPRNRDKANIYFLAILNGEHFVLDINGNAIKPNL